MFLLLTTTAFAQVTSDFQDGTAQFWQQGTTAPPLTVLADAGPRGTGDYALSVVADGSGPLGRLVIYNTTDWTGDWTTAGRDTVSFRMTNPTTATGCRSRSTGCVVSRRKATERL